MAEEVKEVVLMPHTVKPGHTISQDGKIFKEGETVKLSAMQASDPNIASHVVLSAKDAETLKSSAATGQSVAAPAMK